MWPVTALRIIHYGRATTGSLQTIPATVILLWVSPRVVATGNVTEHNTHYGAFFFNSIFHECKKNFSLKLGLRGRTLNKATVFFLQIVSPFRQR